MVFYNGYLLYLSEIQDSDIWSLLQLNEIIHDGDI